jgi:hypothetical protein
VERDAAHLRPEGRGRAASQSSPISRSETPARPEEEESADPHNEQIDAVVMGRVALDTGLGSGDWPWPGKQIYVLTSRPVPADVPADVVVASDTP